MYDRQVSKHKVASAIRSLESCRRTVLIVAYKQQTNNNLIVTFAGNTPVLYCLQKLILPGLKGSGGGAQLSYPPHF